MSNASGRSSVGTYWLIAVTTIAAMVAVAKIWPPGSFEWSDAETETLRSLWLGSLPALPPDPTNAVADNPLAAEFGHALFFNTILSPSNTISCSSCHRPELRFTDGMQKGQGIGQSKRNTPSIVGVAYSPWQYWDGRRDSQWAQALSPIEDPAEHGGNRDHAVSAVMADAALRNQYELVFGVIPDSPQPQVINDVFANFGKAIAAYERLLMPGPSRFDAYVEAVLAGDRDMQDEVFSSDEATGLRLFVGEAACTQCHNGPLFTNSEFHNTGVLSYPGEVPDKGRANGVRQVLADPFNCLGEFSDATRPGCMELEFTRTGPEILGTFRTPSLRNLQNTQPFMHKGQLFTLADVLRHYNEAPLAMIGHNEAKPLGLTATELLQLEAFLTTLAAPLSTPQRWLQAPGQQGGTGD